MSERITFFFCTAQNPLEDPFQDTSTADGERSESFGTICFKLTATIMPHVEGINTRERPPSFERRNSAEPGGPRETNVLNLAPRRHPVVHTEPPLLLHAERLKIHKEDQNTAKMKSDVPRRTSGGIVLNL